MPTMNATLTGSLYGRTYNENQSVTTDNGVEFSPTLAAALAGSLTTRTDNTSGTVTGNTGHGIATGDKIDIYFTGGSRRNVTVGTVSGNSIPISGGSGDNLPALNAALTFMKLNAEGAWAISGANVKGIGLQAPSYRTTYVFRASDNTEIMAVVLPAGASYLWTSESGLTNPVTGATLAKVTITHEGTAGSQVCPGAVLYD